MDKEDLEKELSYLTQEHHKYVGLLCTLVWASKPRLTDGRLWMMFDCKAIKDWLYKQEPGMMERWEMVQQKKLEGEDEQC